MPSKFYDFSVLRQLRQRENLRIADLSERSGVSAAVISKLERNKTMAELETLSRLAPVFGMHASELVAMAESRLVHRTSEQTRHEQLFEMREVRYRNIRCIQCTGPAGAEISHPGIHKDDFELCWVQDGRVRFEHPQSRMELAAGEAIQFDALLEHRYTALEDTRLLIAHIQKGKRF